MKLKVNISAGVAPAVRTAGALLLGNSGVAYFLSSAPKVSNGILTMGVTGAIIILLASIERK